MSLTQLLNLQQNDRFIWATERVIGFKQKQ